MKTSTGGLTALERNLADCAEAGKPLSLANLAVGNHNVVRAEIIERLVRGEPLPGESHPRVLTDAGLQIVDSDDKPENSEDTTRHSRFRKFVFREGDKTEKAPRLVMEELLDLSGASTKVPIELVGCDLKGGISIENTNLRSLKLDGSTLAWLNARDAKIFGSFTALRVVCPGRFDIRNIWTDGDVNLNGSEFGIEDERTNKSAIAAGAAVIKGDFHFSAVKMHGKLNCIGIEILGSLISNGSTLKNGAAPVVTAERAQIAGSVYFRTFSDGQPFSASGQINLRNANVGQDLSFRNAKIACPEGQTLLLKDITVSGSVDFNGAEICSTTSFAVDLRDSHINGRVLCESDSRKGAERHLCVLQGGLSIERATIGSELQLLGVTLTLPSEGQTGRTATISAHSATIGGGLDIGGKKSSDRKHYTPFYSEGDLDFSLTTIGDKVLVKGVQIGRGARTDSEIEAKLGWTASSSGVRNTKKAESEPPDRKPNESPGNLNFKGAKILGFEVRPSRVDGVDVLPSHIGGRIIISDASVEQDFVVSDTRLGDGERSLHAYDANFGGNVYLSQFQSHYPNHYENLDRTATRHVSFSGQINLQAAEIEADLRLTGLHVHCITKGRALDCIRTIVHQNVVLTSSEANHLDIEGKVSFLGADVYGSFLTIRADDRDKPKRLARFHDELDLRIRGVKGRFTLSDILCARGLDATGIKIGKDLEFYRRTQIYGSCCFQNSVVAQDIVLPFTSDCREREKSTRSLIQGFGAGIFLGLNRVLQGWSDKAYLRYARCRLKVPPARLHIDLRGTQTHNLKVSSRYSLKRLRLDLDGTTYRSILFAKKRWLWRTIRPTGIFSGFNHGFRKLGVHFLLLQLWTQARRFPIVNCFPLWWELAKRKSNFFGYVHWVYLKARPGFEYEPPSTRDAIALIDTLPKGREKFSRQPYDQIIRCLRNAGHEVTPRHIEYTLQENIRRELWPAFPFSLPRYPMRWLYLTILKWVSKHGLYVDRTMTLSIIVILFGWWTFENADDAGLMKEVDSATMSQIGRQLTKSQEAKLNGNTDDVISFVVAPQYPDFSAVFYTIDLFLPLIDLYQERFWHPTPSEKEFVCSSTKALANPANYRVINCHEHRFVKLLSIDVHGTGANEFNILRNWLIQAYKLFYAQTLNSLPIIRLVLPFLGWVLVSIMIAVMASRFRTIATMSRGA